MPALSVRQRSERLHGGSKWAEPHIWTFFTDIPFGFILKKLILSSFFASIVGTCPNETLNVQKEIEPIL